MDHVIHPKPMRIPALIAVLALAATAGAQTIRQDQVRTNASAVPAAVNAAPTTLKDDIDNLRYWVLGATNPGHAHTGYQPLDATLTALAGVTVSADRLVYATGPDAFATTSLTPFSRTILDDVDAAGMRGTLGLGNSATLNTGTAAGTVATGNHLHAGVYEPASGTIQAHIASTSNPHATTASQVGAYTTAQVDSALALKASLASPALTGDPTAPTPAVGDNDTSIATTAYVRAQGYVTSASSPVTSVFGRAGAVTAQTGDYSAFYQPLDDELTDIAGLAPTTTGQVLKWNQTSGAWVLGSDNDTVYAHPTGDGNLHVIATGTTNSGKVLTAGATAGSLSWTSIPSAPVISVNAQTGAVVLNTSHIAENGNLYYTEARVAANASVAANTAARHTRGHTMASALDHTDWPAGLDMTELSYLNGVTSAIQGQLDGKAASGHLHTGVYQAANAALSQLAGLSPSSTGQLIKWDQTAGTWVLGVDNVGSAPTWGSITGTLSAQSDLQAALNTKQATLTAGTGISLANNIVSNSDTGSAARTAHEGAYIHSDIALNTSARHARGHAVASATDHTDWPTGLDATELSYVNGVTSSIQTQLNAKAVSTHDHDAAYARLAAANTFTANQTVQNALGTAAVTLEPTRIAFWNDGPVTSTITQEANGSLTVNQPMSVSGLRVGTSTTAGYVLKADASGNATWQPDATGGAPAWGSITGTLSAQTDLQSALSGKQAALTAGTGISLAGNTVSNTDTGSASRTAHEGAYSHGDIALNTAARHTRGHAVASTSDHTDWPAGLTAAELGYVASVTSDIQTQLNAKQPTLSAGTGISLASSTVTNTDTGTAARTAHEGAYTHSDIASNTAARHAAVTLGVNSGLTLAGQQLAVSFGTGQYNAAAGNHGHTGVYQPANGGLTQLASLAPTTTGQIIEWNASLGQWQVGTDDDTTYDLSPYLTIASAAATYIPIAQRGAVNGVASLDASSLVPITQLPTGTTGSTVALGSHEHEGVYELANSNIQSHIASTSNPHGVTASQLTAGTLADARLSSNVPLKNASNTFTGSITATSFLGSGTSLTALNATQLTTGTLPDARLSSNVAMRNATNFFNAEVGALSLKIDRPAGITRDMGYYSGGSPRWILRVSEVAETGGNVGSDFYFMRRADDGTIINVPLFIKRSSGNVGLGGQTNPTEALHVTGNIKASGTLYGSGAGLTAATVPIAAINATGTPSSSTYLRGDGTWSTVSSGGLTAGGSLTGSIASANLFSFTPTAFGATANTYAALQAGSVDTSNNQIGVKGVSYSGYGVYGEATASAGSAVYGKHLASGAAIDGNSSSGYGVRGETASGSAGVYGISYSQYGPAILGYQSGNNAAMRINQAHASADIARFQRAGVDVLTVTNLGELKASSTGAWRVPVGTTAERPASPQNGDIRFNSTTKKYEGWVDTAWVNFH